MLQVKTFLEPDINTDITEPTSEKEKIIKEVLNLVKEYTDAKKDLKDTSRINRIQESSQHYIALKFVMCIGDVFIFYPKLLQFIKDQYIIVDDVPYRMESRKKIDYYRAKYNDLLDDINTNTYMEEELEQKFEELESYDHQVCYHSIMCFDTFYLRVRYIANLHLTNLLKQYPDVSKFLLSRYKHLEEYRFLNSMLLDTIHATGEINKDLTGKNIDENVKKAILESCKEQDSAVYARLFDDLTEITYDNDIRHFLR